MKPIDPNSSSLPPFDKVQSQAQAAAAAKSNPVDSPQEKKLKKAAADFESILVASMWKSMKESMGAPDQSDADAAHGTLDDWGIEVMAGAIGKAGGMGIGQMILKHLEPQISAHSDPNPEASTKVPLGTADNEKGQ